MKLIFLPSGDHSRLLVEAGAAELAEVHAPRRARPAGATCSSYSPLASEKYAIDWPSGDQAGERSCTPGVFVRLRGSPFLAGTGEDLAAVLEHARACPSARGTRRHGSCCPPST